MVVPSNILFWCQKKIKKKIKKKKIKTGLAYEYRVQAEIVRYWAH